MAEKLMALQQKTYLEKRKEQVQKQQYVRKARAEMEEKH